LIKDLKPDMPSERSELLFSKHDWFSLVRHLLDQLSQEVASMDPDRLLNTAPGTMCRYFEEKFTLELPVLNYDGITIEQ
jgi:hypothetical protein